MTFADLYRKYGSNEIMEKAIRRGYKRYAKIRWRLGA